MDEAKKRGRPPKPAFERRRNNQVVRLRDEICERIKADAASHQRSISEELEHRIERSFRDDDVREMIREVMGPVRALPALEIPHLKTDPELLRKLRELV